jgi:Ni/Fe-hydrogenase subunit HybB-like protein
MGVIVNRWNVTLSGLTAPPEWSPGILGNVLTATYTPSLIEIGVAVGVLAYALLAFTLGARFLPVFSRRMAEGQETHS